MKSEEFIREVDEELQRERLATIWRRFGGVIVGAALLAVIGTAAKVGWDQWRQRSIAAEAAQFVKAEAAMTASQPQDAAKAFASLADSGRTGYAELARLREAEALLAANDPKGADAALAALGQGSGDPILRDLGTLVAVSRTVDTGDPAALRAQLAPLAVAGAPWRDQARELQAVIAIRIGETEEARRLLTELANDAAVLPSQKSRAQELLQALGGPAQASS